MVCPPAAATGGGLPFDDRGDLQRKAIAALICELAPVNAFTKVVIMDSRGSISKALAREVTVQDFPLRFPLHVLTACAIVQLPRAVEFRVDDRGDLQRKLNAALICGLAPVNAFTKVVIMDSRGSISKALAREVTAQGYRGFHLKGGFKAWKDAGLAVAQAGEYGISAGMDCLQYAVNTLC
jgi:rhodanese-related sulfurtransferase